MKQKIYFSNKPNNIGGGGSFQIGFQKWILNNTNYKIDILNLKKMHRERDTILVMHGTKKIFHLLYYKICGIRIVTRIDGLWENHSIKRPFHTLIGIKNNISCIFSVLMADKIIMQSYFSYNHEKFIKKIFKNKILIINNGVNKNIFLPNKNKIENFPKILIAEGGIASEYAKNIIEALSSINLFPVNIYGKINRNFQLNEVQDNGFLKIKFCGSVRRELMPKIYQNHHIYFCIEKNACCPNSVLEAMSSGLPIIGFNSGSLKELVGDAGVIINLDITLNKISKNKITRLIKKSINTISKNYNYFSDKAKNRAKVFDSDIVYKKYFEILTNK